MSLPRWTGNRSSNVASEAKYAVVFSGGQWAIRLIYRISQRERELLTTKSHPQLVAMVNRAKGDLVGSEGGAFYINEYSVVLVPGGDVSLVAGRYHDLLEFDFEGVPLSPKAPEGLIPGSPWPGPRVGTAYTLTADASDIRYELRTSPTRRQDCLLSDAVGKIGAARLARRLHKARNRSGRIYINEAREFFAPPTTDTSDKSIYLGHLEDDRWFAEPRQEM